MMFTVIIPVYNMEEYVEHAIHSVQQQTYRDWECIVIDDGSTDASASKISSIAKNDSRIRLIRHPNNRGVSISRNEGIKDANGKYIAFLDADDTWNDSFLQSACEKLTNHADVVLLYSRARIDWMTEISRDRSAFGSRGEYGAGKPGYTCDPYPNILFGNFEVSTSTVVVARNIVLQVGGCKETWRSNEDTLLWYSVLQYGALYYIDKVLATYRFHNAQWTARAEYSVKIQRRFQLYEEFLYFCKNQLVYPVAKGLVTIGLKNIFRSQLPFRKKIEILVECYDRLSSHPRLPLIYRFRSVFVGIFEILLTPLLIFKYLRRSE